MAKHKPPRRRPSPYRTYGIIGFVTIFAIVGGLLASGSTITVYTWWLGLGIATWVLYFVDKLQAKGEGRSRVPELVLLGMVLIGGWVGRGACVHAGLASPQAAALVFHYDTASGGFGPPGSSLAGGVDVTNPSSLYRPGPLPSMAKSP